MASRWSMPPSRFKGRAVPVAWVDFEYPWKTVDPASQNTIERYLLTWLGLAVPRGVRLILIFDRGYARVELIKDLKAGPAAVPHSRSPQSDRADQSAGPPPTAEIGATARSPGPSAPLSPRPLP